jgi:hypothetical protein
MEVREQYELKISNMFEALESLGECRDIMWDLERY